MVEGDVRISVVGDAPVFQETAPVCCIRTPTVFKSQFEIARELVLAASQAGDSESWPLHEVRFENVSMLQVRVQSVANSYTVSTAFEELAKSSKEKTFEDPLDAAIAASVAKPPRRISKKRKIRNPAAPAAAPNSESEDSESSRASSSSSASGESVRVPEEGRPAAAAGATAKAAAAPAKAFFFRASDLGVLSDSMEFNQVRKSRCQLCQLDIERKTARVKYAYHERRPHGYCHLSCVHKLEAGFRTTALQDQVL